MSDETGGSGGSGAQFLNKLLDRMQSQIDRLGDRMDARLDKQDVQHDIDKGEAIKARDEKHEQNLRKFQALTEAIDGTALIARDNKKWIDDEGRPLVKRVAAIEDGKTIEAAETRGRKAAFALIYGVVGGALTFLGTMLPDVIKELLHHG